MVGKFVKSIDFTCFKLVHSSLDISLQDLKRHDQGLYRCRIDFRTIQTQTYRYNLTVIGKLLEKCLHYFIEDFHSDSTFNFIKFTIFWDPATTDDI